MIIEVVGFIVIGAGLLVIRYGPDFGIVVLMIGTLLGAAAALKLPALGGANMLPGHLLLPFYLLALVRQPGAISEMIRSLAFPKPGFWLALFIAYGFVTALLLPRLFAGVIEVLTIDREADGIFVLPLAPSTSNITQPVYLAGDLVLYAAVVAHAARSGLIPIVRAILIAAAVNLTFGTLDMVTYAAGMSWLLDFIRNADYGMLVEGSIQGFKRIVGSFPEASAFGAVTLMYFAFCFEFWLRGAIRQWTGTLALLSFLAVVLCTSSSAYGALGIYLSLVMIRCLIGLFIGTATTRSATIALVGPLVMLTVLLSLMMLPNVWSAITALFDQTLLNKMDTKSGVERAMWNELGLRVFFESSMLGAGLGSVRTSSFVIAVLASTGIVGAVLLLAFFGGLALQILRPKRSGFAVAAAAGGGAACFVLSVTGTLAGAAVDLGLPFFVAAGVISAAAVERLRPVSTNTPLTSFVRKQINSSLEDGSKFRQNDVW
jgi:hypothetical protein